MTITNLLKSPFIYNVYYYVGSFMVNILKMFVIPDDKLILFMSFGGNNYNDNPRAIYERMKNDSRFAEYKLMWAFKEPSKYPDIPLKIDSNSIRFFVYALKARCWINNTSPTRALNFKGKHTFYFDTTHSLLPKLCGPDANNTDAFVSLPGPIADACCVICEMEREIMKRWTKGQLKNILVCGLPKNDVMANYCHHDIYKIRQELGLSEDKTVIIYAPTFRDAMKTGYKSSVDFNKWERILGDDYIVLFRAHPNVANLTKIPTDSSFVKDVSLFPDNMKLLLASDILISDYSGIFWDFGVQEKPMFCFAYDYDEYEKQRGLYFDIRKELPGGFMSEEELLLYIKNGDKNEIMAKTNTFRRKYITTTGKATIACIDEIFRNLSC